MVFVLIVFVLSILHIDAQNSNFQDIVRQKTRGNQIQQCPCVVHPESNQCISYDSRYIAVNIEEAILSFLDLSNHNSIASLINRKTFECQTEECKQCFSLLYNKLTEIGLITPDYKSFIPVLPQSQINPSLCSKYGFSRIKRTITPPVAVSYVQSLINAGQTFRKQEDNSHPAATPPPVNTREQSRSNQNDRAQNFLPVVNDRAHNQRRQDAQIRQNNLSQQRSQFRNNQAMRNRFNTRQRSNWNNNQRQFQQPRQTWSQQPRPLQNFQPNPQYQWNGRYWEPAQVVNDVLQSSSNAWNNPRQGSWQQPPQTGGWFGGTGATGAVGAAGPVGPTGGIGATGPSGWGGGFGGGGGNQNHNSFNLLGGIGFKNRQKRAANVMGSRFEISCNERGDSEDDMLALCGSCWTWRQLPENYFPRIINELSCKTDDYCLSGWGECVQQYRNVDVLRRENGKWVPTVITTATCCDCRVRVGTEIHSLVVGHKK